MKHVSAGSNHYDYSADKYDAIYDKNAEIDDALIANILKQYKVKSIIDLSCGTGNQALYLARAGYEVSGADINQKMLNVAKRKAKKLKVDCNLFLGDMRTSKAGQFDAAITIFNAVGHLTKADFKKAMKNIGSNLRAGGIYVFDIFNLNYMLDKDNITALTIDQMAIEKTRTIRKIQHSTVDHKGVLASHTISIVTKDKTKSKTVHGSQTLQIYSASELEDMLAKCGLKIVKKCAIDGTRFSDKKTKHILLVAKKDTKPKKSK